MKNLILILFSCFYLSIGLADPCLYSIESILLRPLVTETKTGSILRFSPISSGRELSDVKRLKMMSYNTFNLYDHVDSFQYLDDEVVQLVKASPKHMVHRREKARIILEENPEIILLQEVEKRDSLESFARQMLHDRYYNFHMNSNDSRGLHLGFLVRKDLPINIEVRSYNKLSRRVNGKKLPVFTRDAQILILKNAETDEPLAAFMNIHLKSKRHGKNDPNSEKKRLIETKGVAQVIRDFEREFPYLPLVVAGDLNGTWQERTFNPLKKMLKSVFKVFSNLIKPEDRVTHTTFFNGKPKHQELDYILMNLQTRRNRALVDAGIIRYVDEDGAVKPLPTNDDERMQNPSDHFPVWAEFDLQRLIAK